MPQWEDDEPAEPGWYWLRWKAYAGNEQFTHQGLRVAYVQIKQIYTNGKPEEPFIEAYAKLDNDGEPKGRIDVDALLSPQWYGPIAAPHPEQTEDQ